MSDTSLRQLGRDFRWGHRPVVPRSAEEHRVPAPAREFPTAWARSPAARVVRAALQTGVLGPVVRAEVTPVVLGVDRLERLGDGAAVLVGNHASHLDTAVLLSALPPALRRRTAVAAAADYFFDRWWRGVGTSLLFGTVPIERRGGMASQTPGRLLDEGWLVVVFPEGTRSVDGWLGRFRLGAANLALAHGVPLVPVAIRGSHTAMPRGRGWPVGGRPQVHVIFGVPLHPLAGESAAELTARSSAAVARLLDEDATDWWSSLRRAADGATPDAAGPVAASWRRRWESSRPVQPPADPRPRVWR